LLKYRQLGAFFAINIKFHLASIAQKMSPAGYTSYAEVLCRYLKYPKVSEGTLETEACIWVSELYLRYFSYFLSVSVT